MSVVFRYFSLPHSTLTKGRGRLPSSHYCRGTNGQYYKVNTPLCVVPGFRTPEVYLHSTSSPWLACYSSIWKTSCTQQVRTECHTVYRVSQMHVHNFKNYNSAIKEAAGVKRMQQIAAYLEVLYRQRVLVLWIC
jgi:hypothetical protein